MKSTMKRTFAMVIAFALVMGLIIVSPIETKAAEMDYSCIFNATFYSSHYADVQAAFGNNEALLFKHFVNSGMNEGRQGSEEFNVTVYRNKYADLNLIYGDNLKMYYLHYMLMGKAEGRTATSGTTAINTTTTTTTTTTNTELPTDAYKYNDGYFLANVGPSVVSWINTQRTDKKVANVTYSQGIANNATQRAYEISKVFSSGRLDGTPWQTAYAKEYGDIKEMILKQPGVATAQSVEDLLANNTDRMTYITTKNFEKCGVMVYYEDGTSYIIIAFTRIEEKED